MGDLKPLELPIEFFLRLAWNPSAWPKEKIGEYTRRWAEREFGPEHAAEIADIVSKYAKYNGWRKPELITPETFSQSNYREAERVSEAWRDVTTRAEKLYQLLPVGTAGCVLSVGAPPDEGLGLGGGDEHRCRPEPHFARQGRASTNAEARRTRELFKQDQALTDYYNRQLAGGKWNHLMDQPHLGQFTWEPPRINSMPAVSEILLADNDNYGVAIEGDVSAWPDHFGAAVLPRLRLLQQAALLCRGLRGGDPADRVLDRSRQSRGSCSPRTRRPAWIGASGLRSIGPKPPPGPRAGAVSVKGKRGTVNVKVLATKAVGGTGTRGEGSFRQPGGSDRHRRAGCVQEGRGRWRALGGDPRLRSRRCRDVDLPGHRRERPAAEPGAAGSSIRSFFHARRISRRHARAGTGDGLRARPRHARRGGVRRPESASSGRLRRPRGGDVPGEELVVSVARATMPATSGPHTR